jgi:uncharacterized protein (DUF1330 family)
MTCYLVARIAIHDRGLYERYVAGFMPVLRQYGGRLLVSNETPEVLEGQGDGRKLVVLAFDSRDAALTWTNSPEYVEIAKNRHAGSDAVVWLSEGFG